MAIESKMRRPSAFGQSPEGTSFPWGIVLTVVLLVALAAGAWYWWSSRGREDGDSPAVASGAYQAVFLDNGQTYFGKIDADGAAEDGYVRLRGVYYLDFRQNPQDPAAAAADLKLAKLGGEVHGPEDYMDINSAHVIYIEELRADSKIVQAIAEYSAKSNQ